MWSLTQTICADTRFSLNTGKRTKLKIEGTNIHTRPQSSSKNENVKKIINFVSLVP